MAEGEEGGNRRSEKVQVFTYILENENTIACAAYEAIFRAKNEDLRHKKSSFGTYIIENQIISLVRPGKRFDGVWRGLRKSYPSLSTIFRKMGKIKPVPRRPQERSRKWG